MMPKYYTSRGLTKWLLCLIVVVIHILPAHGNQDTLSLLEVTNSCGEEHSQVGKVKLVVGESELYSFVRNSAIDVIEGSVLDSNGKIADGVHVSFFDLGYIRVIDKRSDVVEYVGDVLLPHDEKRDDGGSPFKAGCEITIVKIGSDSVAKPGAYEIVFYDKHSREILEKTEIRLVDIDLSNNDFPVFQANFDKKGKSCDEIVQTYEFVSSFHVNSITDAGSYECFQKVSKNVQLKGARLPRVRFKNEPSSFDIEAYLDELQATVDEYIKDERLFDVFHYKILDEPQDGEYDFYDQVYSAVKHRFPKLRLEYAGKYRNQAVLFSDINVNQIRRIEKDTSELIRSKFGGDLWLYANYMLRPTSGFRSLMGLGIIMKYFGAEGFHLWNFGRCVSDWKVDVATWKPDSANRSSEKKYFSGSGCLVYRVGSSVYGSLRFEALRDAMEDFAIFSAADRSGNLSRYTWPFSLIPGFRTYEVDRKSIRESILSDL